MFNSNKLQGLVNAAKEILERSETSKNDPNSPRMLNETEKREVREAFIRQQQWATMRAKYKRGTPVNIVLKNGKTVSGELLRMDKYDRGTADQGHMLWVKTSVGNARVEDVDVKSIYWDNDPKTKISEETEIQGAKFPKGFKKEEVGVTEALRGIGIDQWDQLLDVKSTSGKWRKGRLKSSLNVERSGGRVEKLRAGDEIFIHPFDGERHVGATDKKDKGGYFFVAKYRID